MASQAKVHVLVGRKDCQEGQSQLGSMAGTRRRYSLGVVSFEADSGGRPSPLCWPSRWSPGRRKKSLHSIVLLLQLALADVDGERRPPLVAERPWRTRQSNGRDCNRPIPSDPLGLRPDTARILRFLSDASLWLPSAAAQSNMARWRVPSEESNGSQMKSKRNCIVLRTTRITERSAPSEPPDGVVYGGRRAGHQSVLVADIRKN